MSEFEAHRTEWDASFEGTRVPGLRAEFYRRPEGDRIASVGRYSLDGAELLLAWGYVDEEHCRHHAVRRPSGGWFPAEAGCPDVELIRNGQAVIGLAVRASTGGWLRILCDRNEVDRSITGPGEVVHSATGNSEAGPGATENNGTGQDGTGQSGANQREVSVAGTAARD